VALPPRLKRVRPLLSPGTAIQGATKKSDRMDELYKGHHITVLARRLTDSQEWQPKLMIRWSEGDRKLIKYRQIIKHFPTQVEADREGLASAKKWIDDGKPDF